MDDLMFKGSRLSALDLTNPDLLKEMKFGVDGLHDYYLHNPDRRGDQMFSTFIAARAAVQDAEQAYAAAVEAKYREDRS